MGRSLAGLLLLGACFFFLLSDASDALISQEGHRSPELSGQNSPKAAEQQQSKEHADDRPSSTSTSPRWPLSPRPVQVTLYGEARCPFCADWLVKNSQKLVGQVGGIIEFRAVEFGNARRNATTGELQCQHGPSECEANALFACTREAFSSNGKKDSSPYRWLNVIVCSERDVFEEAADPLRAFDACVIAEVKRGGSPFDDGGDGDASGSFSSDDDGERAGRAAAARLRACASGDEGARLVAEAEEETTSLSPKHT